MAARVPLSPAERDNLITDNLQIVRIVTLQICRRLPRHVLFDDLYDAGVIGLVDAADKFNPAKERSFNTYAAIRVRGAILDSLRRLDWAPRRFRSDARRISAATDALTGELGRTPTAIEVACKLGMRLAEYQTLLQDLQAVELRRIEDESEEAPGTLIFSQEPSPLERCIDKEQREWVVAALAHLPDREHTILMLYYYDELSMKEIAEIMGVVESRISQLHAAAVNRLRRRLSGEPEPEPPPPKPRGPYRPRKPRDLPAGICAAASLAHQAEPHSPAYTA